jgi:DNA-binding NtrC family response regulator
VAALHSVLLVAPEGQLRDNLQRRLRNKGHLVSVAGQARPAMEVLSELQFDLVASWPVLPDGSGAGFLAEVQRRYPASALLLLGTDPAAAHLDFELLLRISRLVRAAGTRGHRS